MPDPSDPPVPRPQAPPPAIPPDPGDERPPSPALPPINSAIQTAVSMKLSLIAGWFVVWCIAKLPSLNPPPPPDVIAAGQWLIDQLVPLSVAFALAFLMARARHLQWATEGRVTGVKRFLG